MKILLFGGGGHLGRAIANEALNRGHFVSAVTRRGTISGLSHFRLLNFPGDATDAAAVSRLASGHDAIASAVGPAPGEDPGMLPRAARGLLDGTFKSGLKRLVVVGGAGSLEAAPGVRRLDQPDFPTEWKPVALGHASALELYRADNRVDWTVVSPSDRIDDGARTGRFRTGGEQLLVAPDGSSRISVADFAIGFVDEFGRGAHPHRRVTLGY